ncbi:hypothetical protein BT96DRAFT_939943 [Gymnopus androsaceus JB14]|uniref:Uncharacterized protein n=1 Tax=Gymnopus androsaceus JB14 TaxID=1447944 RepID=A0A6A4HM34_9AGAR|nr:hypothetical protein BT96DRAFT_939943 [Gymnopus androsaceus JB14]
MSPILALDVLKQIKAKTDELNLDLHWHDLSPWEKSRENSLCTESEPHDIKSLEEEEDSLESSEEDQPTPDGDLELDIDLMVNSDPISPEWRLPMSSKHVTRGFALVQQSVEEAKVNPIIHFSHLLKDTYLGLTFAFQVRPK